MNHILPQGDKTNVLERYTVLLNSREGVEEAYHKRGDRDRAVFHSGGQRGHSGWRRQPARNTKAKI